VSGGADHVLGTRDPELYVTNANGSGQTRTTTSGGVDRRPDW
jgi:hypothetical protein